MYHNTSLTTPSAHVADQQAPVIKPAVPVEPVVSNVDYLDIPAFLRRHTEEEVF